MHPVVQHAADELCGRELTDLLGEVEQETGVDAGGLEFGETFVEGVDEGQGEGGVDEPTRMINKGNRACEQAMLSRFPAEVLEQELMTLMNPVEKADTGGKIARNMVKITKNLHFFTKKFGYYENMSYLCAAK
jgi:hypothetical protein